MDHKQRTADLLLHYIRFGMEAGGYTPDSDTRAEIEDLVDYIVDPLQRQIDALEQRIRQLEDPR